MWISQPHIKDLQQKAGSWRPLVLCLGIMCLSIHPNLLTGQPLRNARKL